MSWLNGDYEECPNQEPHRIPSRRSISLHSSHSLLETKLVVFHVLFILICSDFIIDKGVSYAQTIQIRKAISFRRVYISERPRNVPKWAAHLITVRAGPRNTMILIFSVHWTTYATDRVMCSDCLVGDTTRTMIPVMITHHSISVSSRVSASLSR